MVVEVRVGVAVGVGARELKAYAPPTTRVVITIRLPKANNVEREKKLDITASDLTPCPLS